MGMPGMSASDMVTYAQSEKSAPVSVIAPTANVSKMTVAELRNRVNPMTKYYDFMTAKAFIEDTTISMEDKIAVVYGKYLANGMRVAGLSEAVFNEIIKKVVE